MHVLLPSNIFKLVTVRFNCEERNQIN